MKSFAYTQIKEFNFNGCKISSKIKEHDNHGGYWDYFLKVYPCSNFFEELKYAVLRTTNKIQFWNLELSSREFIQLAKAAKKAKKLIFQDCKIPFDSEFDFGPMKGSHIEKISIDYFDKVYDEWSEYEECLMKIFWGILNCKNLIGSLKDLNFKCIDDLKEKMREEA